MDASLKRHLIVKCKDARCPWHISAYENVVEEFRIAKDKVYHWCDLVLFKECHPQVKCGLLVTWWGTSSMIRHCTSLKMLCGMLKPLLGSQLAIGQHHGLHWLHWHHNAVHLRTRLPFSCIESSFERLNLGNKAAILTDEDHHVWYFFFVIGASIKGCLSWMRPIIVIEASPLKSKYKGVILVTRTFGPNCNIYCLVATATFTIWLST